MIFELCLLYVCIIRQAYKSLKLSVPANNCSQLPDSPKSSPRKPENNGKETDDEEIQIVQESNENASENKANQNKSASDNEEKSETAKKEPTPEKKSPKKVHSFFSKFE